MAKKDITIRNPNQWVAEKIYKSCDSGNGALVMLPSLLLSLTVGFGSAIGYINSGEDPDTVGNVEQTKLVEEFNQRISDLKKQQFKVEKVKAVLELANKYEDKTIETEKKQEFLQVQQVFAEARDNFFKDLYFKGVDKTGAGLSEENIAKIYKKARDSFNMGGFKRTPDFSMLDETITEMAKLGTLDIKDYRVSDAKILHDKLKEIKDDRSSKADFIFILSMILAGIVFPATFMGYASKFKDKPKRLIVKKAKSRLPARH